jgi:hypothetical protein
MSENRWHVIIRYHSDHGFRDIERDIEELDELHDLVEGGPSWYAIKGIVITHNRKPSETRTLERAMLE